MCSDWKLNGKERELSLDEIQKIFRNPLFTSLHKFNLSGGEPVLRDDMVQVTEVVMKACPQIKEIVLLTNGLDSDLIIEKVRELQKLPIWDSLNRFAVSVSLDGYGKIHEKIRRVPEAFEKVNETILRLKELGKIRSFYISTVCVVQPLNISDLPNVADYCREQELPTTFVPVWLGDCFMLDNVSRNKLRLNDEQVKELKSVINGPLKTVLNPSNIPCWHEFFSIMNGGRRESPCHLERHFVGLDTDGTLFLCNVDDSLEYGSALETPPDELWYSKKAEEVRKRAEENVCPTCTQCCDSAFTFSREFFYYARFLLRQRSGKLVGM
jgi:MoaA/NifB/PqqE/SkfB family radical SAM enzyme